MIPKVILLNAKKRWGANTYSLNATIKLHKANVTDNVAKWTYKTPF